MPADVARVVGLMANFPGRWGLCGGWAADAWLGHISRAHHDVDVVVFEDDQLALRDLLAGWQMVAHDDNWKGTIPIWPNQPIPATELWTGRHVDVPGHFHVRSADNFDFEINIAMRDAINWVLHTDPRVAMPVDEAIAISRWGVPTAVPAVVACYKLSPEVSGSSASGTKTPQMRPKDEADVRLLLPILTAEHREWLHKSVASLNSGHPWLQQLKPPSH